MAAPKRSAITTLVEASESKRDLVGGLEYHQPEKSSEQVPKRRGGQVKPPELKKRSYTFAIEPADLAALTRYADRKGISVNAAIRMAIKEMIR